eukprot:3910410-Rhodomonas_salina.1
MADDPANNGEDARVHWRAIANNGGRSLTMAGRRTWNPLAMVTTLAKSDAIAPRSSPGPYPRP